MVFVTFDPENGDLELNLPEEFSDLQNKLYAELVEEFIDTDIDSNTIDLMNTFVEKWLQENSAPHRAC